MDASIPPISMTSRRALQARPRREEDIEHVSQYVFTNAWELAEHRLRALELTHDTATGRRLDAAGVGEGWRCLEVGAGHGSVARLLRDRVGPSGTVVAVDIDARLLSDVPGIDVVELDVVHDPLPEGLFDLVHTRMVLMHLPARDAVLPRLASVLRPGGVLLLEEQDVFPLEPAEGAYGAAWTAFIAAMAPAGVDPRWARRLPARCACLGLADVTADVDVGLFPCDSPAADFWRLTWRQAVERIRAAGGSPTVIEAGIEALSTPGDWFLGPAMVAVTARRA
jgi:ubiquinone/menaquinone biosynthesis C-methylase UbiE